MEDNLQEQYVEYVGPEFNGTIAYLLPTSNHENRSLMAIAGAYAVLFMFGTCGNVSILAILRHVMTGDYKIRHNTTLTYICILSIVDFLSMLPLPMTIIDQILGFWMFGTFACKLFRLLEHIGKIFSTFILVAFSIDRYLAVCHPLNTQLRTPRMVYCLLGVMFLITCIMLSPILVYARSKELIMGEMVENRTGILQRWHLYKCVDDMSDTLFISFTVYSFLLAYLLPLLLMIYFYYAMLARLFRQSRVSVGMRGGKADDRIPIFRIAAYTLAICLFHFVCWTPYWVSVLYSSWKEINKVGGQMIEPTPAYIYAMYGIHALPYVNSASNFILYGLLNRQLHQSNRDRRRIHRGTVVSSVPPALRFTECSDAPNGFSAMESTIRTPPSEASSFRSHEKSPLVNAAKTNGYTGYCPNCQLNNGSPPALTTSIPIDSDAETVMI